MYPLERIQKITGEAWRYLLQFALCANGRKTYCCCIRSEKSEEDGRWWSFRSLCQDSIDDER